MKKNNRPGAGRIFRSGLYSTAILAAAVVLAVLVNLAVRTIPARVECGGTFCRGMVVADLREHPIEAPGVSICVDVDSRRALEELLTTFMA